MAYSKLVRDNIPEILKSKGIIANIHIADKNEYESALINKLREEVEEYIKDPCEEEIADIIEVIRAIAKQKKYDINEIEEIRCKKAEKRGSFEKRIISVVE